MPNVPRIVREESQRLHDRFDVTPEDINAGMCDLLAKRVCDRVDAAEMCDTERVFDGGHHKYPGHAWIFFEDRHYDAECPDGVECFLDLPFFQRHRLVLHENGFRDDLLENDFTESVRS